MNIDILTYLVTHAVITIGGVFAFLIRIEHRLTRLETKVEVFEGKNPK